MGVVYAWATTGWPLLEMAPCGWGTPTTVGRGPRASPRSPHRPTLLAFTACDLTADGFTLTTTRPLTDEELAKTNVTVCRFPAITTTSPTAQSSTNKPWWRRPLSETVRGCGCGSAKCNRGLSTSCALRAASGRRRFGRRCVNPSKVRCLLDPVPTHRLSSVKQMQHGNPFLPADVLR